MMLIDAGELHPFADYWGIGPEYIGMISLGDYGSYSRTWEAINTAESDYIEGWRACKAHYELLADWESAIKEDWERAHHRYVVTCSYCGFAERTVTKRRADALAQDHRRTSTCDALLEIATNITIYELTKEA